MAEVSVPHATTSASSTSPPPNCAICLGTCTNKCFSDSCMHQFCFTCLLEWSKVKPECPLCKQAFTSIIHNVKSNHEYDEHIVEPSAPAQAILDDNEFLYLPTAPPSRHFQFRTTFTVDPRGELAIQQMLLTHSRLTNSVYMPNYNYNYRHSRHRHRRDVSSTNYRRMVYDRNMWVTAPPDITGRYREISPHFFRENPAAINRLVPWLNRELNALLEENTQQVMLLVDVILTQLSRHHIRGYFFKNLLREYLGNNTDHFIHEFYNYMKSPYDMVGYDRHAFYTTRNSFVQTIPSEDSSSSTDSDITVVATASVPAPNSNPPPNPNPFHRPTLEVIEINSDSSRDSDVVIQEPPPPVVVDLINTTDDDDDDEPETVQQSRHLSQAETKQESNSSESDVVKYNLVFKRNKKNKEKYDKSRKRRKGKSSKHCVYSSSDSDSSSSSDSNNYKYYKRRKKQKPKKASRVKYCVSSSTADSTDSDDEPLLEKLKKLKNSSSHKSKRKDRSKKSHKNKSTQFVSDDGNYNGVSKTNYYSSNVNVKTDVPSSSEILYSVREDQRYDSDKPLDYSMAGFAGPSYRSSNSPKIKKERISLWYSRPRVFDSDSSDQN